MILVGLGNALHIEGFRLRQPSSTWSGGGSHERPRSRVATAEQAAAKRERSEHDDVAASSRHGHTNTRTRKGLTASPRGPKEVIQAGKPAFNFARVHTIRARGRTSDGVCPTGTGYTCGTVLWRRSSSPRGAGGAKARDAASAEELGLEGPPGCRPSLVWARSRRSEGGPRW